jgi:transcription elongation factor GreA
MSSDEIYYLTAVGAEKLKKELEYLKSTGREELARRLRFAIQQGDLSENADYSSAKEDQAFMEGRIQELERTIKNMVIIEDVHQETDVVNIGDMVTIQEEDFPEEVFHIVGPKEADPRSGKISNESPIGKALMGHKIGDTVTVETPGGQILLKIVKKG